MSQTSFIHGFHAIIAKLRHQPDAIVEIFIAADRHDARARDLLQHAELHNVRVIPVDAKRLDGMAGGPRHQGVVALISGVSRHITLDDVLDTLEEPPFLLVLDGVQDPHNLGACLRVADAVGAHAVIAPKDRAVGLTQTAAKARAPVMQRVTQPPSKNLTQVTMTRMPAVSTRPRPFKHRPLRQWAAWPRTCRSPACRRPVASGRRHASGCGRPSTDACPPIALSRCSTYAVDFPAQASTMSSSNITLRLPDKTLKRIKHLA